MISGFFHGSGETQSRKRIMVSYQKISSPDLYFKVFELDETNSIVIYRDEEVISIGNFNYAYCLCGLYSSTLVNDDRTYISYYWIEPSVGVKASTFQLNNDFSRTPIDYIGQGVSEYTIFSANFTNEMEELSPGWSLGFIDSSYYLSYITKGVVVTRRSNTSQTRGYSNIPMRYYQTEWGAPYKTAIGTITEGQEEFLGYTYNGIGFVNEYLSDFNINIGESVFYYSTTQIAEGYQLIEGASKPYETDTYSYIGFNPSRIHPLRISDLELIAITSSGYVISSKKSQQGNNLVYDFGYNVPIKFIEQDDEDSIEIFDIKSHNPYKGYLYPVTYTDVNNDLKFKMIKNINYLGIAAKDVDSNGKVLFIASNAIILDGIISGKNYYADKIGQSLSTVQRGNEYVGYSTTSGKLELR